MAQVRFGPFRLDGTERRLLRANAVIALRPKTFAVLNHLVSRPGRLATKEQLLTAVWPETAVSDTVLKVCVREIREALGDDPGKPRYVETVHRLGYRFIAQVFGTNLPAPVSTLVGRRREITDITNACDASRLVTLVGAGGSGKSRLALEVAGILRDNFESGAWWVDLAPFDDDAFVPQAVAVALGVRDQPGESLTAVLARYLSTREILLVVDNCEHLLSSTAALLERLLRAATRLRVLATSREPLKTEGERVYPVAPLSTPECSRGLTAAQALEYDAVRLFDERARAVSPSFILAEPTCQTVVDICRRLDGLPLALELAAARVPAIPLQTIDARLDDALRVLGSGRRSHLPRHETLRATIDWSYDLLDADERHVFARLSVFADSFTLEAAEHIVTCEDARTCDVFDVISRLIDKSLVFVTNRSEGDWRYRLLETVRQYAHEKLRLFDDAADVRARYVEYYLDLSETVEPVLNTAERPSRLASLERDHGNFRAAIERALQAGNGGDAARLASALFWFWFHRGYWREGRTFLRSAIEYETASSPVRARALLGDGVLAWAEGDHAAAATRLEECVAIGRVVPDARTTGHALHFLAMVRLAEGHAADGRPLAEEAVRIARDAHDDFNLTVALASYGVLLLALDGYDEASAVLQESVDRARQSGDAWAAALPLRNLAIIACRHGDYDLARTLLEESLHSMRNLEEKWFLSRSIETLAEVLASAGDCARSALLFGAADTLREAVGASILAFYKDDYDRGVARARQALGSQSFEHYWRLGRSLSADEMVDCALDRDFVERSRRGEDLRRP
jgi:non-specific serine/threonine protein kinase